MAADGVIASGLALAISATLAMTRLVISLSLASSPSLRLADLSFRHDGGVYLAEDGMEPLLVVDGAATTFMVQVVPTFAPPAGTAGHDPQ